MTDDEREEAIQAKLKELGHADEPAPASSSTPTIRHARPPAPLIEPTVSGHATQNMPVSSGSSSQESSSNLNNPNEDPLDAAERRRQEKIKEQEAQNQSPIGLQNAVGAGVGLAASKLLENQMPDYVPYNKETKANQEKLLEAGKTLVEGHKKAAEAMLPEDFQAHQDKGQALVAEKNMIELEHAKNVQELSKAQDAHELHKNLTVDNFLPPNLRESENPLTSGEKHSVTSGYSAGEGTVEEAVRKYKNIMPKGKVSKQYLEMLGDDTVKALQAESKAKYENWKQQREQALPQATADAANAKSQAVINANNAKQAHDASMKQLRAVNQALDAHLNTPAPTIPRVSADTVKQQKVNEEIEKGLTKRYGSNPLTKLMSRFPGAGSDVATPITSGALAPYWAEKTQEAFEKQPNLISALTDPAVLSYGVGTVGALASLLPHRYIKGAGVLAQLPAAGREGYDLATGALPEKALDSVKNYFKP
jgi:hypothetical protein